MEKREPEKPEMEQGGLEPQIKGGRWLTPEQYSQPAFGNLDLDYVKKLIWPNCDRKHCPKRFDERDLKRFSRKRVMIYFMLPNIAGVDRPRIVNR